MPFLAGAAAAGGAGAAGAGAAGAGAAGLGAAGAAGAGAAGAGAAGLGAAGAAGAGAAGAGAAGAGAAGLGAAGTGVTAGGLGSGAIGTGMTGAQLAAAPSLALPSAGAAGGGGMLSGLSSAYNAAQPYINTGSQIYDMIKPNGSLSQGDISTIAKQGAQLYSGLGGGSDRTKLPGPISPGQRDILHGMSLNPLGGDTLGEKFSLSGGNPMTKEQFDALSPEMRQALLKIVAGR